MSESGPVLVRVLLGATGSGKTGVTEELDPSRFEVVGCDSRQIYRGMEIGTACPSEELRARLPHHLVAWAAPDQAFSAGEYARRAREALIDIARRGREPILVGGTGFYYQALRTGLFGLPSSEESRRTVLGLPENERVERLRQVDPDALVPEGQTAAPGRIHPNDTYRVSRALEIFLTTGTPWSVHWANSRERMKRTEDSLFRFEGWILLPTVDWEAGLLLRARAMLGAGFVLEARRVREEFGAGCAGLRTLGYDLALAGPEACGGTEQLAEALAQKHRQYARKQRLWFRRETGLAPADRTSILRALSGRPAPRSQA